MMKLITGRRFKTSLGNVIIHNEQNEIISVGEKILYGRTEYVVKKLSRRPDLMENGLLLLSNIRHILHILLLFNRPGCRPGDCFLCLTYGQLHAGDDQTRQTARTGETWELELATSARDRALKYMSDHASKASGMDLRVEGEKSAIKGYGDRVREWKREASAILQSDDPDVGRLQRLHRDIAKWEKTVGNVDRGVSVTTSHPQDSSEMTKTEALAEADRLAKIYWDARLNPNLFEAELMVQAEGFQDVGELGEYIEKIRPKSHYLRDSLEQVALGNWTDKTTGLGTAAQIALGFTDLDLPMDIQDVAYDITHLDSIPWWQMISSKLYRIM